MEFSEVVVIVESGLECHGITRRHPIYNTPKF